jgi:hypothetical protein
LLHSTATSSSSQPILPLSFLLQLLLLPAAIPACRSASQPNITCCCCLRKPFLQQPNRHSMLQLLRVLLLRMQLMTTQLH